MKGPNPNMLKQMQSDMYTNPTDLQLDMFVNSGGGGGSGRGGYPQQYQYPVFNFHDENAHNMEPFLFQDSYQMPMNYGRKGYSKQRGNYGFRGGYGYHRGGRGKNNRGGRGRGKFRGDGGYRSHQHQNMSRGYD